MRAVFKGGVRSYGDIRNFSCLVVIVHWSARVYGYFEVGRLMGLFVFSHEVGVTLGPFVLIKFLLLKPVA